MTLVEITEAIKALPADKDIVYSAVGSILRERLAEARDNSESAGVILAQYLGFGFDGPTDIAILVGALASVASVCFTKAPPDVIINIIGKAFTTQFQKYREVSLELRAEFELTGKVTPK